MNDQQERDRIFAELNYLIQLNRITDMPRRIELCERALELTSRGSEPQLWAKLQDELGCCLAETPEGSRAENQERAIEHFRQVLAIRTQYGTEQDLASTKHNLATVYRDRIRGKRAKNIDLAIDYYQEALRVRTRTADPQKWAFTQSALAVAYLHRISGIKADNLELALEYCHQALQVFKRQVSSYHWAHATNTLGEVYRNRIRDEPAKNLDKAIDCFRDAESVFTRQAFPKDWAMVHQNLGAAYTTRIYGARAENLEQAILHCKLALEIFTFESFPQHWASVHYNLGNAYRYRVHGDQPKNIKQAIEHLELSERVRTLEEYPEEWARSQNNLGNVYLALANDQREQNIERAIHHYQQALTIRTRHSFPKDWAETQNNLGNAYMERNAEKWADSIEQATTCYWKALEVRTENAFPEDWAETLNNLAQAELKSVPPNVENAIGHLQQALQVYTRERFPQYWARTHNNLAIAYTDRKMGQSERNLAAAANHYSRALEVYTPEAFPVDCIRSSRALANLYFEAEQWALARDSYDVVFDALDVLMHASFSMESEKAELAEVQNLSPRAAYAHWKTGNVERAVEVLEKGRAQLLRESFEQQWRQLERLQHGPFHYLYDRYMDVRNQYRALQGDHEYSLQKNVVSQRVATSDWRRGLEQVQAAAAAIREEVGKTNPEYRYFLKSLSFSEIQEQAEDCPLVYLLSTHAGGLALIIGTQGAQPVDLPNLEQESLQQQIWRLPNEVLPRINKHVGLGDISLEDVDAVRGGFFSVYSLWSIKNTLVNTSKEVLEELSRAWHKTLIDTTRWLWDVAQMEKDLLPLLQRYGKPAIFIPAGQLAVLPLHAAWREDASMPTHRRHLMDDLIISYVPSTHALWRASLAENRPASTLLAIDNPDGTLHYAEDEVQSAMDMSKDPIHLQGSAATKQVVTEKMKQSHVLHFSTHGRAGWHQASEARLTLADSELSLPNVVELDLVNARLAVLSACETGIPGFELLDEMIGLPAGMLQAGVPGVVASLWAVDDMSTAILMAYFYFLWRKERCAPRDALCKAQIWLRDKTIEEKKDFFRAFIDGRCVGLSVDTANSFYAHLSYAEPHQVDYSSPFHWAAFTYTGV